jgi:4-hydroxy-tetrahydrodipicolinate synthase
VIEQTREAKKAGADLVMIVTPFYEIPNQEGLYRHYATIAETVDMPIVLYNIPPHTNVEIGLSTLEKLVEIDNIVALKESSGNLAYFAEAMLRVGGKMPILTGGDDISLPCFAMGCHGAILALANIAPGDLVSLYKAVRDRDMDKAAELYYRLLPIARAISTAENFPAPLKEAVNQLGRPAGPARSPIMPVNAAEKETIRQALKTANLL